MLFKEIPEILHYIMKIETDAILNYFPLCLVTLLVLLPFEVVGRGGLDDPAPFLPFAFSDLAPLTLGLERDSNMAVCRVRKCMST